MAEINIPYGFIITGEAEDSRFGGLLEIDHEDRVINFTLTLCFHKWYILLCM